MSVHYYGRGDHGGGFVGFRVTKSFNGDYRQSYFSTIPAKSQSDEDIYFRYQRLKAEYKEAEWEAEMLDMNESLRIQAASLRQKHQSETEVAVSWLDRGVVRNDESFTDKFGRQPFSGCEERLVERMEEMANENKHWDGSSLALWCKQEADSWFVGFPDDTKQNRRDFTASLFGIAKERLRIMGWALS